MEIYIKLFEVLLPVFFIVGIGYFLGKKKSNIDTTFITNYSADFGAPALFIFAITSLVSVSVHSTILFSVSSLIIASAFLFSYLLHLRILS